MHPERDLGAAETREYSRDADLVNTWRFAHEPALTDRAATLAALGDKRATPADKFRRPAPGHRAGTGGFALVELMIVVSILGVLAAIGFPIYSSMHQRARVAKAYGDARSMVGAVTLYASHNGSLPVALASLTQSSQNELGQTAGPFLVAVPASPSGWGAYSYTTATDGTYTISASGDGTTVRLP